MSAIISRHVLEIKSIAICDELECVLRGRGQKKMVSGKMELVLPWCNVLPNVEEQWSSGNGEINCLLCGTSM